MARAQADPPPWQAFGRGRPRRALLPPASGGGARLAHTSNPRGNPAGARRVDWRPCAALLLALASALAPCRAAEQDAAPCAPGGQDAGRPRLLVSVTGARPVAGNITFTLYGANPAAFLAHRGSLALSRVTLASSQAEACFSLSAPGAYAVAVYHDANDNHRFDRTLLGLPAEGYGFSNNVAPLLLPSFQSARIAVPAGETRIAIRLIY